MIPTASVIDLGAPLFWWFLAVAAFVLTPLEHAPTRRYVNAAVNVAFIGLVGGWLGACGAVAYSFTMHRVACAASPSRSPQARVRYAMLSLASALAVLLFIIHKALLPLTPPSFESRLREALAAVGFSYVALRSVEILRAGVEGALQRVGWIEAVSYLFPFHMLAAGPIQSWSDFVAREVVPPRMRWRDALSAIERIVHGLFKKFVLARAIEIVALTNFRAPWPYRLLEIQAYCVWVFLDFSAYSDIAVGAGRLIGVATPENFNSPFAARNIIDFWSRWHISLSAFVRRTFFIPIQLLTLRRTQGRHAGAITSLALIIAFLFCGLWHAVTVRFVVWGLLQAGAILLCSWYGRAMSAKLGRLRFAALAITPTYRFVAVALTFQFVAFTLAFVAFPPALLFR